jgi:RHS repeat-associated protein
MTSNTILDPNNTATNTGQCPSSYPVANWQSEKRSYFPTGDLFTETDPDGNTTQYAYDPVGRQQVAQDPMGRQTATLFDLAGDPIAIWKGGSAASSSWIASNGTPALTNIPTSWTPSTYTGTGPVRYESFCPPAGGLCYSANGKALYAFDANNNETAYDYDGLNRLAFTRFTDPSSGASLCTPGTVSGTVPSCTGHQTYEQTAYDSFGNKTLFVTRNGGHIVMIYDSNNHLVVKTPTSQGAVTYGLNLLGEPLQITRSATGQPTYNGIVPVSHTTGYTYDAAGRKSSESNDGRIVGYVFDANSNRSETIWPDLYTVYYAYDAVNRMSCVTEGSASTNELAYYAYDPLSRRQNLRLGGNAANCAAGASSTNKLTYTFSTGNELMGLANQLNTATVSMGYQYNPARQIKMLSLLNGTDPFYLPGPTASASTSFTPNALNEYGSINGGTSSYDNNGNLLSVPVSAGVPAQSYTYDTENHLVTASVPSIQSSAITYDYDGLGRRVSKTVGSTSTTYLLDGDEEIAEYSGTTLLRRYVTGPAVDDRIVHVEGASTTAAPTGSTHTYYHVNHQGSVIAVTDYTGAAVSCLTGTACQRLAYDEYGNLSSAASAIGEAFRYTGRRFDTETGLYYYRARYYSPLLGRFLQTDPVGYKENLNLYTYVSNDPLDKTDPSGTSECADPTGVGCPTSGTPQKTATPGHDQASVDQMKQMVSDAKANGETNLQGSYNRSQKNATGGLIDSQQRTDATLTSETKTGEAVVRNGEIASPSQTKASQVIKLDNLATKAAPGVKVQNYVESLSGAAKGGGKALGAVGPLIAVPGAIIEAIKNPNMSPIEFLYRLSGQYDVGVATGQVPPPNTS